MLLYSTEPPCRCSNTTILELKASPFFHRNLQQLAIITDNVIDAPSKDIDLRLMLSNTGSSPISTTSFGSSLSVTPSSIEARKRSEEHILEEPPVPKKRKTEKIDM